MGTPEIVKFVAAFVLVLGLIALAAFIARRLGLGGQGATRLGRARRLAIVEALALDAKRRLVLVRRDQRELLLLLGPSGDVVVDRTTARPAEPASMPNRTEPSL